MRRLLLLLALLLLAVVVGASAAAPAPTAWYEVGRDIQFPVEQQSPNYVDSNHCLDQTTVVCDPTLWVRNPTGCVWDIDDHISDTFSGALKAGQTLTDSLCTVNDFPYPGWWGLPHTVELEVTAPRQTLTVTLTSDQGSAFTLAPAPLRGGSAWLLCFRDGHIFNPAPPVPDSNGGVGGVERWTATVTAAKATNNVFGAFQVGGTTHGNFTLDCAA